MSSLIRRIQRASTRKKYKGDFGKKLGVHNTEAKDLVARLKRENKKG